MTERVIIDVAYLPAEGNDPAGYLATSEEVGLVVEADTLDRLVARVRDVLPDLLAENVKCGMPVPRRRMPAEFEMRHVLTDGDGLLQGTA